MNKTRDSSGWKILTAGAALAALLVGCQGDDGSQGPAGPPGSSAALVSTTATSLNMTITGATINSPPVVNFTVTNESGKGFVGLTTSDLRFDIAKLVPGSNGDASYWLNYIVTVQNGTAAGHPLASAVQGTRENNGTLVDHGDGTYTYTFGTDITNVTCPAPCQDSEGKTLDLSYQPTLTHRIGIQTRGSLPAVNTTFDFVPAGGAVTTERLIVDTAKCNECHDRLEAHDARVETKYCVTCHNPGSTDPDTGNTVDFKVMIHKIHRGEELPSNVAGGDYSIIGFGGTRHSFKDIGYPQDIRNCTKCHDGADTNTPQGDNWETHPTMEACGSCHDNIKFDVAGPPAGGTDPDGHSGGVVTDNSECITCHAAGRIAGSIAESHAIPEKVAAANFKYNILQICGIDVGSNPVCAPGSTPTVKFSVTDPTGATTHGFGNAYDILDTNEKAFNSGSVSRLAVLMAWDTRDYNNTGGGSPPSSANSFDKSTASSNGDGTFTITGTAIPVTATGTGTVAVEGHPAAADSTGAFTLRVPVKSEVAYFGITDTTPKPRRTVVNAITKCDRCHDLLAVHGNNRNDNGQLCVMCHTPNNTDVSRRPADGAGAPDATASLDGKKEESIDFKRMIHAIHAAANSNFDGTIAHGFRNKGIVVYGFGGGPNDFSGLRFPGDLTRCTTCHLPDTFTLADRSASGGANWEAPAQNNILGSTIDTMSALVASPDGDPTNDLKISPTAAVCSSCHDGTVAQAHMAANGGLFSALPAAISTNVEQCVVCHGPSRLADVAVVHTGQGGETIP